MSQEPVNRISTSLCLLLIDFVVLIFKATGTSNISESTLESLTLNV